MTCVSENNPPANVTLLLFLTTKVLKRRAPLSIQMIDLKTERLRPIPEQTRQRKAHACANEMHAKRASLDSHHCFVKNKQLLGAGSEEYVNSASL